MTPLNTLTKRENEVAGLLLEGKSNKQIAFALGISESTVEFHLRNIYRKLDVVSRGKAMLTLGKSTGLFAGKPRDSLVERKPKTVHTGGVTIIGRRWLTLHKDTVSIATKEINMKNRLVPYILAGLIFGMLFWNYFSAIGYFTNALSIDEENPLVIWAAFTFLFLAIFGVWFVPAMISSIYEFRRSRKVGLSTSAVVIVWVSAVFGYYLTYIFLLAFVGLPNMDYYLVLGQRGPTFWHDWGHFLLNYILFDFLKWIAVGVIGGGTVGLFLSSLYSIWVKKKKTILTA